MAAKKSSNFETNLKTLEKLVDKLEQGDLPLDQALKEFEQGIQLARQCQTELQNAEQKVHILLKNNAEVTDYTADENNE
jgi:exodeoxyribonuclease VII small subunit